MKKILLLSVIFIVGCSNNNINTNINYSNSSNLLSNSSINITSSTKTSETNDELVITDQLQGGINSYSVKSANDENGITPLVDSFNIKRFNYYVYKVGTIYDVPLQTENEAWGYEATSKLTKSFSTTIAEEEVIEHQVVDATENCTITNEYEMALSGINVSIGAEVGGESVSAGMEFAFNNVKSISATGSFSETVTNTVKYSKSYTQSTTYEFSPETSKKGFYRYVLLGDVDVFLVEVLDKYTNEVQLVTGYPVITGCAYCLEYSQTKSFKQTNDDYLEFKKSENENLTIKNDYNEDYSNYIDEYLNDDIVDYFAGVLRFNMTKYQKTGSITENINYSGYNNGELIITPLYNNMPIYEVQFIGSTYDENGIETLPINNLTIRFLDGNWKVVPDVVIKDLKYKSSLGDSALDFSAFSNLNLYIEGECSIESLSSKQSSVINGNNINIYGDKSSLELIASNGVDSSKGNNCINCNDLKIESLNLTALAGNGTNGVNGKSYNVKDAVENANSGGAGTDGSDGGDTILCTNLYIDSSILNLTSGSGGNGGNGGNGQGASSGLVLHISGSGGNGGNGGNSGNCINVKENCQILNSSLNFQIGTGGTGGNGGQGGNGEYAAVSCVGQGGKGGNGGKGGDTGEFIFTENSLIDINNVDINIALGTAGNGGNGGNAGSTKNNAFCTVAGNNGGNGGNGGNIIINHEELFNTITFVNDLQSGKGGNGGMSSSGKIDSNIEGTSGSGGNSGCINVYDFEKYNEGSNGSKGISANGGKGGSSVIVTIEANEVKQK